MDRFVSGTWVFPEGEDASHSYTLSTLLTDETWHRQLSI
jgi:hypothetical protein